MSTLLVQFIFVCFFFLTCTRNEKKHLFNNETNKVIMQKLLFENRVQFTCVQNEKIQNHTSKFWCSYLLFYSPIKQNFHQLKRFSAVCKTSLSDNSVQVIVTAVQENKYVQFTRLKTHLKNFATCTLRMDKIVFHATENSATYLWQSMHSVVIHAGQDSIASLEGTFSTFCLDFLVFFLLAEDSSWFSSWFSSVLLTVFILCCTKFQVVERKCFMVIHYGIQVVPSFNSSVNLEKSS